MARKVDPKWQPNESPTTAEDSLTTSMASFVSDMLRFAEGNLSVDELLQRNQTDGSDRETARTIRQCGKKISIN